MELIISIIAIIAIVSVLYYMINKKENFKHAINDIKIDVNDQITDAVTLVKNEIKTTVDNVQEIEKKLEEDVNNFIKKTGITEVKKNKKSKK